MPDVFISYAVEDEPIAGEISHLLTAAGYSVFYDRAIAAGSDFSKITEKALIESRAVVVLLSRNSNRSNWVNIELRNALHRGQVIIPVLLDEEAKSNWVWPLVSDRRAIEIDSPARIADVVREVNLAMRFHEQLPYGARPPSLSEASSGLHEARARSQAAFLTFLVAVFSAIAGAMAMWWLLK